MADEGSTSVKIGKLNDLNFHSWKQKIILVLAPKDLNQYIKEDGPSASDDRVLWRKGDRKAHAIIGLPLSHEHLEHVRDVDSAKKMWKTILNAFERHTLLNKLRARRIFYTVTMESGEKALPYLNSVKYLASALKSFGVEADDHEQATAALNGLPSSYENLILALDALGNDDRSFTFDMVKSRLIQEEQCASEREKIRSNALHGSTASGGN